MDINLLKQWRFLQEIDSDFFYFYFVLLQDVSTTLQCVTKEVKKQKGGTTNYITGKESPNYLALAFDLVTALGVDIHVNLHVMENKQHGSFTYNSIYKKKP